MPLLRLSAMEALKLLRKIQANYLDGQMGMLQNSDELMIIFRKDMRIRFRFLT
jgi:hypothetical protein